MKSSSYQRRGGPKAKLGRKTRIVLLLLAIVIVAAVLYAYSLASRVPSYYRPAEMSAAQRDLAMREFRRRLMDFSNDGQGRQPFDWSVTEEQLNRYLDAMDVIAVQGGAKPGAAERAMASAGLEEPAISLDDGRVRLMARSRRYDRIVSIDIGLAVDDDGLLHVGLDGAHIGRLPMPASLVSSYVDRLRDKLSRPGGSAETAPAIGGLDPAQVAQVIQRVLSAIDGKPISTKMSWRITTRKTVRVRRIDISDGKLTLHLEPILPADSDGNSNS